MPEILKLKISTLKLLEKNPRKIDKDKFHQLCSSLEKDPGFLDNRPILIHKIGDDLNVYAGNQRVRAAKKLGWKEVPCIVEEHLSEEIIKNRIIKDNLHSGEWDYDLLANEWPIETLLGAGFDPEDLIGKVTEIDLDDKPEKEKKTKSCPHCGADL